MEHLAHQTSDAGFARGRSSQLNHPCRPGELKVHCAHEPSTASMHSTWLATGFELMQTMLSPMLMPCSRSKLSRSCVTITRSVSERAVDHRQANPALILADVTPMDTAAKTSGIPAVA